MDGILEAYAANPEWIFIMALILMSLAFSGCIVAFSLRANVKNNYEREQTRREIAAYIAEGSMSPEEGERLLNAGKKKA